MSGLQGGQPLVVDTNVVLDCFVFGDARASALRAWLLGRQVSWLTTVPMRDELERVLGYPAVAPWLVRGGQRPEAVLRTFDACTTLVPIAPVVPVPCRDPDDQKFADLAACHAAMLLSRDRAVLALARRLRPWHVAVGTPEQLLDASRAAA